MPAQFEKFFTTIRSQHTPALIWYSAPGERIELSGKVLDNWVSKTANFLVDECEIAAGDSICLDMEPHWRSFLIALAALRVGAKLDFDIATTEAETIFSFTPENLENLEIDYPVVVDRGPLSPRYMGQVPADALDYCAQVRSYGDVYSGLELPDASGYAFAGISFADIFQALAESQPKDPNLASFYLPASQLSPAYLLSSLSLLQDGRGVIILDPKLDWEESRIEKILADEKADRLSFQ